MSAAMYTSRTCRHCGHTHVVRNGAWFREQREKAGVSLREVARRSGLSAPFLSDVERNRRAVSARAELAYAFIMLGGRR